MQRPGAQLELGTAGWVRTLDTLFRAQSPLELLHLFFFFFCVLEHEPPGRWLPRLFTTASPVPYMGLTPLGVQGRKGQGQKQHLAGAVLSHLPSLWPPQMWHQL